MFLEKWYYCLRYIVVDSGGLPGINLGLRQCCKFALWHGRKHPQSFGVRIFTWKTTILLQTGKPFTCDDFEIQAALVGSLYARIFPATSTCLYLMQTKVLKVLIQCFLAFLVFIKEKYLKKAFLALFCFRGRHHYLPRQLLLLAQLRAFHVFGWIRNTVKMFLYFSSVLILSYQNILAWQLLSHKKLVIFQSCFQCINSIVHHWQN